MTFMRLPDRFATRLAAFSLIGVVNSAVGAAVIVISGLLGASPILANVFGYGVGLVVSFTLNSRLTFRSRSVYRSTVIRFLAAFAVSFAINLGVVRAVTDMYTGHNTIASLSGMPFYSIAFYLLCEYWVFRRRNNH